MKIDWEQNEMISLELQDSQNHPVTVYMSDASVDIEIETSYGFKMVSIETDEFMKLLDEMKRFHDEKIMPRKIAKNVQYEKMMEVYAEMERRIFSDFPENE